MTNTTARPATTGKRGIQLNQRLFAKAIAKAQAVRPRVVAIGSYYGVMMSDQHTMATVHFVIRDGAIWATCTCKAHVLGDSNLGKPVPCYHIAAAFEEAQRQRATTPRPADQPGGDIHHHLCPLCGDAFDCNCPTPNLNQTCQDCDVRDIERAELEGQILRRWQARYPHNSQVLLGRALLKRFGVSTLDALPDGTLQQVHQALGGDQ